MHRPTGMVNPDSPLGHHIAQDAGHISSTVLGAAAGVTRTQLEISAFHGEEPEPDEVDLPFGDLDSWAIRLIHSRSPKFTTLGSIAYVDDPEAHEIPRTDHIWRYSASAYTRFQCENGWRLDNAFIFGLVNYYDGITTLASFGKEFVLTRAPSRVWGRLEVLERASSQLAIRGDPDPKKARWVAAATLGYTHDLARIGDLDFHFGGSVTKSFLPEAFEPAYGGEPWSGRVFIELSGMKMWSEKTSGRIHH